MDYRKEDCRRGGIRRRMRVAGLLGAVFAAVLIGVATAATTTTRFPFTTAFFNTCNNDLIIINGTQTVQTTIIDLGDGRLRFRLRDRMVGTGEDASGNRYTFMSTTTDEFDTRHEPFVRSHQVNSITLKKVGGPSSEDLHIDVRQTLVTNSATGEVQVEEQEFEAECK
jgi:hypothetical protein